MTHARNASFTQFSETFRERLSIEIDCQISFFLAFLASVILPFPFLLC